MRSSAPPHPLRRRQRVALAALLAVAGLALPAAAQGVTLSTNPLIPVARVPLEVTATFEQPVQSVRAFLRPTGSTEPFREVEAVGEEGGLRFRGTVPAEVVSARGFEGYVRYSRAGGTFTEPQGAPQAALARFPVLVPRIRAEVPLQPRAYRMVAVPLQFYRELGRSFTEGTFEEVFEDDYGAYDPNLWRVLRWDPGVERYREREEAVPLVRPGEAFWLITADGSSFDVEGAATPGFRVEGNRLVQGAVTVALAPGWNQIGSPFAFDLAWNAVEGRTPQVGAPVAFGPDGYEPLQSTLRPWEGYFVENRGSAPVTLTFRVPSVAAVRDGRPVATRYLEALGPGGYLLQLSAEGGRGRDLHTYVGVAAEAGAHDLAKTPPVGEGPYLAVEAEDRLWAGRVLPPSEAAAWTLVRGGESGPLTLTLTEHGSRPAGTLPVLRDAASGAVLAVGTGTVTLPAGTGRLHLGLVPEAEAPALPASRWLDAVYPNPARPTLEPVSVRFWAPEGEAVALEVYDALGRRVAALADAPGDGRWRVLAWDGLDGAGRALPAGTYLVRLRAGEQTLTRRLTLLR